MVNHQIVSKILLFIIFTSLLVCSCGPARIITNEASQRIQVKETVTYVPYMVKLEIPEVRDVNRTRDTSSHLENKYAASDAIIHKDGTLEHSLRSKPQEAPQIVYVPATQRDSIVEKEVIREVETVKEVEKPLSWWQRFRLNLFWPLLAVVVLAVAIRISKLVRLIRLYLG